jgi:uncharacterized protein YndB with AHSA1/START domain
VSRTLRYERLIHASPMQVFDAFTSPEGQREIYRQNEPGWIVESHCDLRVGGTWSISFGPEPGQLYQHDNVFEEIDRPHRVRMTTTEIRLDGSRLVIDVEFTFEARGDATLMTMTQRGFPTDALRDEHALGLQTGFDNLERVLTGSTP